MHGVGRDHGIGGGGTRRQRADLLHRGILEAVTLSGRARRPAPPPAWRAGAGEVVAVDNLHLGDAGETRSGRQDVGARGAMDDALTPKDLRSCGVAT